MDDEEVSEHLRTLSTWQRTTLSSNKATSTSAVLSSQWPLQVTTSAHFKDSECTLCHPCQIIAPCCAGHGQPSGGTDYQSLASLAWDVFRSKWERGRHPIRISAGEMPVVRWGVIRYWNRKRAKRVMRSLPLALFGAVLKVLDSSFSKAIWGCVIWSHHIRTDSVMFQKFLEFCACERRPVVKHHQFNMDAGPYLGRPFPRMKRCCSRCLEINLTLMALFPHCFNVVVKTRPPGHTTSKTFHPNYARMPLV